MHILYVGLYKYMCTYNVYMYVRLYVLVCIYSCAVCINVYIYNYIIRLCMLSMCAYV